MTLVIAQWDESGLPAGLQGIGYLQGADLYLWIACIGVLFVAGVMLFWRGRAFETKVQRRLFFGYGLFCVFYGLTRLLFAIAVVYNAHYDEYTIGGYITGLIALVFIIGVIERYLLKDVLNTRFAFTIISTGMLGISVLGLVGVIERATFLYLLYVVIIADILILSLLYGFLIVKGVGSIRKKTAITFLGVLLLYAGNMLDSEVVLSTLQFPLVIPPLVIMGGVAIFTFSQFHDFSG